MARMVKCSNCDEIKPHEAKGLCKPCYCRQYKSPIIICSNCGEKKFHYAKGLCKACYRRRYNLEHQEEIAAYNQHYHKEHKEEKAAYYRNWHKANYERRLAYCRQWRKNHREEGAAYLRRWRKANPEKVAIHNACRRARERGAAYTLTPEQIEFEQRIGEATYPKEKLDFHHLVPLSKGGGHTWGNIMFLPASLNRSIQEKLPEEIYVQNILWATADEG